MTRLMVDCIHVNVPEVKQLFPSIGMIAWYGTGSPDIRWDGNDLAEFPDAIKVLIDQGGEGGPLANAVVRDVETGAWTPASAVHDTPWDADRPTIYCNRSTLPSVIGEGWRGDVILAWPGYDSAAAPVFPGVTIVAVQNQFDSAYDLSTVYDNDWPYAARKATDMINGNLSIMGDANIPFPSGSFTQVMVYRNGVSAHVTATIDLAFHSLGKGYVNRTVLLDTSIPVTVKFPEADIDGLYLRNTAGLDNIGYTIS